MKIILSHGYFLADDPKEQEIMRPYPPLGILYINAYLKRKGIATEVYDTTFSTKQAFRDYLLQAQPNFIGLYVNLMTKLNILEIMRFVRGEERLKHTRIILGGPEVTHHDEAFLRAGADFIILGEGETTIYDLLTSVDSAFSPFLDTIDGIAFINRKGDIVRTKEREKIKDIDILPFPDRKAIDLNKYFNAWKDRHGYSTASVSTMRGCPYTCKWCSRAVYGLSYRRRSPKLVVEELAWMQDNYAVDSFWFVDDVFTISHKWLAAFAEELMLKGIEIKYECITRADRLNEEAVALLEQTGCFRVWIGAESGSQRILGDGPPHRGRESAQHDPSRPSERHRGGHLHHAWLPGRDRGRYRRNNRAPREQQPRSFHDHGRLPHQGNATLYRGRVGHAGKIALGHEHRPRFGFQAHASSQILRPRRAVCRELRQCRKSAQKRRIFWGLENGLEGQSRQGADERQPLT
jgi:B12 binding domain/Radical SAM superfamily